MKIVVYYGQSTDKSVNFSKAFDAKIVFKNAYINAN